MFIEEVKKKFKEKTLEAEFTVTLIGSSEAVISGIKNVALTTPEQIKIRIAGRTLSVTGEKLCILEIGGGDVFVKGDISGVNFE